MTLEAHATAAGAGHPPRPEPAPGVVVNLAETMVIKEENVFAVTRRDGSYRWPSRTRSGSTATTAGTSPATSCASGVRPRLLVSSAAPAPRRCTS